MQHPFGDYIDKKFLRKQKCKLVTSLRKKYQGMVTATTLADSIRATCDASEFIDRRLYSWKRMLGGGVTPFSTFRGFFLEEVTLNLARLAVDNKPRAALEVVKLSTDKGVVTGISLAFRRQRVPDIVPIQFRRDREDVIIGFRRTLRIQEKGNEPTDLTNEIIPVCVIACKMYIDATRLENVLAKAKNMYNQYSSCHFLVVAEWDALAEDAHDQKGQILDSLFAPVNHIVFLRGTRTHRPPNNQLKTFCKANPYLPQELKKLYRIIMAAIKEFSN